MLRESITGTAGRRDGPPAFDPVNRILTAGRLLAIAGALTLLVVHFADVAHFDRRLLNANAEATVWTWSSVVAAFGVSLGAGLHALLVVGRRTEYAVLAGATAFLSLDDLTILHETFAYLIVTRWDLSDTRDSLVWPVLYLPLLLTVVGLLERLTRAAPARIRRFVLAGLASLAFAILVEVFTAPWSGQDDNWVHDITGGFEEAAEQAGWTLLATAMIAVAIRALIRGPRVS